MLDNVGGLWWKFLMKIISYIRQIKIV
jgi:hypothetical protein